MKYAELISQAEMTAVDRAAEIAAILAAALARAAAVEGASEGPLGLGFSPEQSVHASPARQETRP